MCSYIIFVFHFVTEFTLYNRLQVHPPRINWLQLVPYCDWLIFHCVYEYSFFTHSSVDRHLGCFHVVYIYFLTPAICLTHWAVLPRCFVHAFSSAWNAFSFFLPLFLLDLNVLSLISAFPVSNLGSYSVFVSQKLLSGFSPTCFHSTISASVSMLLYNCPSVSASLTWLPDCKLFRKGIGLTYLGISAFSIVPGCTILLAEWREWTKQIFSSQEMLFKL